MGNGIRYYDLLPVVNKRIIADALIHCLPYFRYIGFPLPMRPI
jgi:hypothetical protein